MPKENTPSLYRAMSKKVSTFRSPRVEIYPNILTHGYHNNEAPFHSHVAISCVQHLNLKSSSNTQPNTRQNIISKKISFSHVKNLGVNLAKRFDNTLANTTPTS